MGRKKKIVEEIVQPVVDKAINSKDPVKTKLICKLKDDWKDIKQIKKLVSFFEVINNVESVLLDRNYNSKGQFEFVIVNTEEIAEKEIEELKKVFLMCKGIVQVL